MASMLLFLTGAFLGLGFAILVVLTLILVKDDAERQLKQVKSRLKRKGQLLATDHAPDVEEWLANLEKDGRED
jgi:uncharacterized membrane protein YgaE (UPF0421/DUF939 family)